jgi:T5SS/PEP-CTERM-associated repeat protein
MFHQFFLIFDELRLINPRIFPLAALLLTALNPLSAQVSITGDVSPSPASSPAWTIPLHLLVGISTNGTLSIGTGGTVTNTNGYVYVGYNSGSNGTVNVSGGTWTNVNDLFIGISGTGALNVSNGTVTNDNGIVGASFGSNGTVNVSGGSWVNTSDLIVGYLGTGTLTLNGTGSVSSNATTLGFINIGTGTLNLNGGTLTTGQVSEGFGSGTVTFNGGTLRLSGNQTNLFAGFETNDVTLAAGGGTIDTQT